MKRPLKNVRPIGPFSQSSSNSKDLTLEDLYGTQVKKSEVYFHSSEDMRELQNNSVALAVTSPPYNFGWDYNSFNDESEYVSEYLSKLANVFKEVFRVLMPEGRLAINVPTIDKQSNKGDEGNISIASDIISMMTTQQKLYGAHGVTSNDINRMQQETDWMLEDHIIRNKGVLSTGDRLGSLGTNGRPFRFNLNSSHESILIFQKPGKRDIKGLRDEIKKASGLDKSFWSRQGNPPKNCDKFPTCHTLPKDNLWTLPTDNVFTENGERVPSFPEELPRRLIKAYSFVGDTVIDPFTGSGTTLKVANDLERLATGYETNENLKPLIERRVGEKV